MNKQEILEEIRNLKAEQRDYMDKVNSKINELEKKFNDIESSTEDEEEWIPKNGEGYYFYNEKRGIISYTDFENDSSFDLYNLKHHNCFKTEEETKKYKDYYLTKEKAQNEFSKEEWQDIKTKKYSFYLEYYDGITELNIDYYETIRDFGKVYFRTEQECKDFIKKYKKFICRELGYKESEVSIDE